MKPTYAKAIIALSPDAKFQVLSNDINQIDWQSDDIDQPNKEAIQAKLKELEDEYEKQAYARSRADAYDPIPEQLDQIYHDMDGWKKRIKAVKDKYPKPT